MINFIFILCVDILIILLDIGHVRFLLSVDTVNKCYLKKIEEGGKNMENHVLGFFMKNIVFHIYLSIVEYTYTL